VDNSTHNDINHLEDLDGMIRDIMVTTLCMLTCKAPGGKVKFFRCMYVFGP